MKDKIQSFLLTPIKVSYKKSSDYTLIEKIVLNPIFLAMLVFFITFQAYSLSSEPKSTPSDSALSNAMVYFEKGDFDNAVLQLESVVSSYSGTTAAYQAKFYLGRTAFINGNNDKALVYLSESVSKLKFPNLKKEGYIMLAKLENNPMNFDKAIKSEISESEQKYIYILKAKMLAENGNVDQAIKILDSVDTDNTVYNDFFEEVYGFVLSIN
jgi:predicted negative regulator of RcsB-dependent stress response